MDTQLLSGKLTRKGFARFKLHARRIVHVDILNYTTFDVTVWRNLFRMNNYKPLLPRMRHCGWYVGTPFKHDLMLAISPRLRSLDVRHWDEVLYPDSSTSSGWKLRQKRMLGCRDRLSDCMVVQLAEVVPDLPRIRICSELHLARMRVCVSLMVS